MIRKISAKLNEKNANGTLYIGVVIMIVAFIVVLVCVNLFQLYTTHTRAQLVCDAIADGSAIAGQTTNGYHVNKAKDAAEEIFKNNKIPGTSHSYTIDIYSEYDAHGQYTGYQIIEVYYTLSTKAYSSGFLDMYSSETLRDRYAATAFARVRAKATIRQSTWLTTSYAANPNAPIPFHTTTPGARSGSYATWVIDYHLCPQQNPLYNYRGEYQANCLLFDYLKCLAVPVDGWRNANSFEIMHSNFTSGIFDTSAWTELSSAKDIQMAADAGRPTIILCKERDTNFYFCYIAVPQKNAIGLGEVALAYTNWYGSSNYSVWNWEDFCQKHSDIIAITTS